MKRGGGTIPETVSGTGTDTSRGTMTWRHQLNRIPRPGLTAMGVCGDGLGLVILEEEQRAAGRETHSRC